MDRAKEQRRVSLPPSLAAASPLNPPYVFCEVRWRRALWGWRLSASSEPVPAVASGGDRTHAVMLLKSTAVHSAVWHWSKTSELWENWDTSRASSHLSCSEIRRKKMWLVVLTLATLCVCLCRHGGETVTTNCLGWNRPNRWFSFRLQFNFNTEKKKSQHIVWTAFTTTN